MRDGDPPHLGEEFVDRCANGYASGSPFSSATFDTSLADPAPRRVFS
jgi:hypothetical protein